MLTLLLSLPTDLKSKSSQFEDKLESEDSSEQHVEQVERLAVLVGLVVVLHG